MTWEYVAAFLDGEGSVSYIKSKDIYIIRFFNTDYNVLKGIRDFLNAGRIYLNRDETTNTKKCYLLDIQRHSAILRIAKELQNRCFIKARLLKDAISHIEKRRWRRTLKDLYMTFKPLEKKELVSFKEMKEEDWRGVVALLVLVGGFIIIGICVYFGRTEVVAGIVPLMTLVAKWYFDSKEKKE